VRNLPRFSLIAWFAVLALVGACAPGGTDSARQASQGSPSTIPSAPVLPLPTVTLSLPQVSFSEEPPDWLSDPAVDVLAVAIGNEPLCSKPEAVQLLFINAETGEEFDLTTPPARAMLWLDSQTFGLLSMDGDTTLSVDLTDGSVEPTSFEAEGILLLSGTEPFPPQELICTMGSLELVRSRPTDQGGVVLAGVRSDYSADLSFIGAAGGTAEAWQVASGELVWTSGLDDPPGGRIEYELAWSPVERTQLAVIVECDDPMPDIPCEGERLYVVDVATGQEVGSYPGDFMGISWSPDGTSILYQHPEWQIAELQLSGPPCVLDLRTGENRCFWEVVETHFPEHAAITYRDLFDMRWDRYGNGFFYSYMGVQYILNDLGTPDAPLGLGGLCHFEIITRQIDCPSEDQPELQGNATLDKETFGLELSPSGRFGYVQASRDSLAHGILDLGNGRYAELPGLPGRGYVSVLWRPPSRTPVSDQVRTNRPTRQGAQDIQSIWAFYSLTEGLDLTQPGTRSFAVDVDPASTFIWPYYWCASDKETLADNLRSITVDFMIDEVGVPATDILEYKMLSADWDCQFWATTVSGWQSGSEPSLAIRYSFSQDVFDGVSHYPAGEYSFEVNANVMD